MEINSIGQVQIIPYIKRRLIVRIATNGDPIKICGTHLLEIFSLKVNNIEGTATVFCKTPSQIVF
jgi:hypothetical protein